MKYFASLLVCMSLLFHLLPQPAAQAAAPTPPPPPTAPTHGGLWDANKKQRMAAAAPALGAAESQGQPSVGYGNITIEQEFPYLDPWARSVYVQYTPSGWELYSANATLTSTRQLTRNAFADIEPQLNHGATSIVFLSLRDNNDYEIYRINPDGSGETQLTNNTRDDMDASWSRDSSRILFSSNRAGDYEIYSMAPDGSQVMQLTDNALPDFAPTFSPDNSQIAWVQVPAGSLVNGEIWVMGADGSHPEQILAGAPLLDNLFWSPDGRQMAYNSDADGDGFYELYLLDLASKQSTKLEGHPAEKYFASDYLATGWLPDGKYISVSVMNYISISLNPSAWGLESTRIMAKCLFTCNLFNYMYAANLDGYGMQPSWASADTAGPRITFTPPLPAYTPAAGAPVGWGAADPGGSGVRTYDAQISIDGGAWQDWKPATTDTSAVYTGLPGQALNVRVRATDQAYNLGAWTTAKAPVRLYAAQVMGQTLDNRGQPLPGSSITVDPPGWEAPVSDLAGNYQANLLQSGAHRLETGHPGFGSLPAATLLMDRDRPLLQILPPLDNALANGNFENGPADWNVQGDLPSAVLDQPERGNKAALLGLDCAWPCLQPDGVFDPRAFSTVYDLAADSQGGAHLLGLSAGQVLYYYRAPGGGWSAPQALGSYPDGRTDVRAEIEVDGSDTLYAVWGINSTFAWKPANGDWSDPQPIDSMPLTSAYTKLAVGKAGQAYLIYQCSASACSGLANGIYARARAMDGTWGAPVKVGSFSSYPVILDGWLSGMIAPDGKLHIVTYSQSWIYHNVFSPDGALQENPRMSATFVTYSISAAMTGSGVIYVIGDADVYGNITYLRYHPETGWQGTTKIVMPALPMGARRWITGVAPTSGDRLLILGITSTAPSQNTGFAVLCDGSGLLAGPVAAAPANPLKLVTDSRYRLYGASLGTQGASFYQGLPLLTGGETQLSQTVTVPSQMRNPTLAFVYKITGNARQETQLRASIEVNGAATEVFSTTAATPGWQPAWIDLTPWQGQAITVRFAALAPAGALPAALWVDDASIGSWNTPVIHSVSPKTIPSLLTAPMAITVAGQNLSTVVEVRLGDRVYLPEQIDDATLRFFIQPGDLPSGKYDLLVTDQNGAAGGMAGALDVLPALFLPLVTGG